MRPDWQKVARCALCLLSASLFSLPPLTRAQARAELVSAEERDAFHRDPQWASLLPHLPDPQTGSAKDLETAGDVLRARRFPHDALDYYGFAISRGANVSDVMNKMGVIRIEMRQTALAHELFQQVVRAHKKDPAGWNNLGVTEYMQQHWKQAIADYKRAAKIDRTSPVYLSNLGMAYFESGDTEAARREFSAALKLDPHAWDKRESGGSTAQVVGSQHYAQLAYEMARVYARHANEPMTILWLAKATEAGYDTKYEMANDAALRPYMRDSRVVLMWKNAQQMRLRSVASAPVPSLGPSAAPLP